MKRPALFVAALLLGLVAGCTDATGPGADPQVKGCGPLRAAEVVGRAPGFAPPALARFDNDGAVCGGMWFPPARSGVIPQGLALDGRTAYVSGFDGSRPVGQRPCSVTRIDLRTGRTLARTAKIAGSVGPRPEVYCRHGGGLALDDHGLWLAETTRLWLIDPARIGQPDPVIRVWALAPGVTGSFAVRDRAGRLGLGQFATSGTPWMNWYDVESLLASPAITLGTPAGGPTPAQIPAIRRTRVPVQTQGATIGPNGKGLWFARSVTTCAELVSPTGKSWAFVPGAEDLEFDSRGRLWVVSESGAKRYQRLGRPLVPHLVKVDPGVLSAGVPGRCGF